MRKTGGCLSNWATGRGVGKAEGGFGELTSWDHQLVHVTVARCASVRRRRNAVPARNTRLLGPREGYRI
jgi:hypothetical protein